MGTFSRAGIVSRFYSSRSWIEGSAERQLEQLAELDRVLAVAAFPDLHPGRYGPVGAAADFDSAIYPGLIGTDIGCGVTLAVTDVDAHRIKLDRLVDRLSDVMSWPEGEGSSEGITLGSIGHGNHFLEVTAVSEVIDETLLDPRLKGKACILVHSGSRSFGAGIFERIYTRSGIAALTGSDMEEYLELHDRALRFAALNRAASVRLAAGALRAEVEIVSDVPHNHVERIGDVLRHRKGASSAMPSSVVLGSRGTLSYLAEPGLNAPPESLASLAHGSGRRMDRASARARFGGKGVVERESRNPFGGRVVCVDKDLSAEESPGAYKSIGPVIEDLTDFGLARPVAALRPIVTWKTAGDRT